MFSVLVLPRVHLLLSLMPVRWFCYSYMNRSTLVSPKSLHTRLLYLVESSATQNKDLLYVVREGRSLESVQSSL